MTNIQLLISEFCKPLKIEGGEYFLGSYFTIEPQNSTNSEYKIAFLFKDTEEPLKAKLVYHLFEKINEAKIIPVIIDYTIPDNKCVKSYFPFEVAFTGWDHIPTREGKYNLTATLPTDIYINFYDSRYNKIPLYYAGHSLHTVEFSHEWLESIIVK